MGLVALQPNFYETLLSSSLHSVRKYKNILDLKEKEGITGEGEKSRGEEMKSKSKYVVNNFFSQNPVLFQEP